MPSCDERPLKARFAVSSHDVRGVVYRISCLPMSVTCCDNRNMVATTCAKWWNRIGGKECSGQSMGTRVGAGSL